MNAKLLSLILLMTIAACHKPSNNNNNNNTVGTDNNVSAVEKIEEPVRPRYNPSFTRVNDIIHTILDVSFDYKNQRLMGKATLQIKPHFYPTSKVTLHAQNFDLHKVQIKTDKGNTDLKYEYKNNEIQISLDRTYLNTENYFIYIEYTAKPNEKELGGSAAIAGDKGLYFINPDSTETNKHVEIWTQGETESNSSWFPTIDKPNEKMTHEIYITVRDEFKTLSNGILVSQKKNNNGTRTDHWKMMQPHAPYLVMMAIGDYAIVTDKWKKPSGKEIEVAYYVEKKYEQYARDIFGATPAMLEFFSRRLGVEYPWDKYAQVVVRDYVSGAMENTTATIHGEFLYKTKRELIDGHNESIIAHELFHHWFGDLVTCESWSNLPLNESFANYSQYLWDEHRHGVDVADHYGYSEMNGYMMSTKQGGYADMIRFDYLDKEEMFDAHSYNKGGRILHMLRGIVGDDAFFESLKVYLTENQFQPAEMHQLRLAFEKVTGVDYNWYFNQWFFAKGHPILLIKQEYSEGKGNVRVIVEQKQKLEEVPLYILPVEIDIYTASGKETHKVEVKNRIDTFNFNVSQKPLLVNFDAQKTLLCEKKEEKPIEQYVYQYYNAPKYLDRREAVEECGKSSNELAQKMLIDALRDKCSFLREITMKNLKKVVKTNKELVKTELVKLTNDTIAGVRATAIKQLSKYFEDDKSLMSVYEKAITGESYEGMAGGLIGISKIDAPRSMELARQYEKEDNIEIRLAVADIYAEHGTATEHAFFIRGLDEVSGFEKFGFISTYCNYLKHQNDVEIAKGIDILADIAKNGKPWWLKFSGYQQLSVFQGFYSKKELELKTKSESLRKEGKEIEANQAEQDAVKAKNESERIAKIINDLKAQETDKNILQYLNRE